MHLAQCMASFPLVPCIRPDPFYCNLFISRAIHRRYYHAIAPFTNNGRWLDVRLRFNFSTVLRAARQESRLVSSSGKVGFKKGCDRGSSYLWHSVLDYLPLLKNRRFATDQYSGFCFASNFFSRIPPFNYGRKSNSPEERSFAHRSLRAVGQADFLPYSNHLYEP